MYHGAGYRKLGRKTAHRLSMFSNAASSLIEHERIETTLPKAKELRRVVERLITKAKGGSLHDRRNVFSFLRQEESTKKLFDTLAPRFKERAGGYTRVLKLAETRLGDAAPMALIEFVDYVLPSQKTKEEKKKARSEAKAKAKEEAKSKAASRPAKAPKAAKAGKTTGKAGANSSVGRSGSRGT